MEKLNPVGIQNIILKQADDPKMTTLFHLHFVYKQKIGT
jgi:hypothetical protein